jgi:hypothetical protein
MTRAADLDARRDLLVTKCELDRIELALAWHDVRRAVVPEADHAQGSRWLRKTLAVVIPLFGVARARRMSRYVSAALLALRLAIAWRAGTR